MDCSSIYEPEPDVAGQAVSNIKNLHFLLNLIQTTKRKTHLRKSPGLHSLPSPYRHSHFPGLGYHTDRTNISTSGAELGLWDWWNWWISVWLCRAASAAGRRFGSNRNWHFQNWARPAKSTRGSLNFTTIKRQTCINNIGETPPDGVSLLLPRSYRKHVHLTVHCRGCFCCDCLCEA